MSASPPIVLQNSANERSVPKMGNIGIQMAGFLNQNSPFRTCFRKVFFASGRKKVLQQIPPNYGRITAAQRTDALGQSETGAASFDHLVGECDELVRNGYAE